MGASFRSPLGPWSGKRYFYRIQRFTMRARFAIIGFAFCLGLCWSQVAFSQSILLNYYNLTADGADVLLEWEVQDLDGIVEFQVFRRLNNESSGAHVATLRVNGSKAYSYLDDNIFKTDSRVIHYELHIVTSSRTETYERSLSHNPTSIQRTWGSIKSMFRY